MPRVRPGRVRTKNTNHRAPLRLSSMAPEDYNVREGETKSIACPDCRTWRRIMGDTVLKIREHEGEQLPRCPGSDQLVVIDIDVRRWEARQNRLLRDAMPQDNRRSAQQFYKPIPAPAPPVTRLFADTTLKTARQAYLAHYAGCVECGTGQPCGEGGVLAHRYVRVLGKELPRREASEQVGSRERRTARQQSAGSVREAQWARYGGEAVERANNRCAPRSPGSLSEFRGPDLPMLPQNEEAHERRQTELGRQYTRKTPAS
ncbi:hypothetical protein ACWCWD_29220 [Streptomyces sp. NPDC001493]